MTLIDWVFVVIVALIALFMFAFGVVILMGYDPISPVYYWFKGLFSKRWERVYGKDIEMAEKVYKFEVTVTPKGIRKDVTEKELDVIAEYIANVFDLYSLEVVVVYEAVQDE